MGQPALRHCLEGAIRLMEKFAAKTLVILKAVNGMGEQLGHERLIAKAVKIIDKVF